MTASDLVDRLQGVTKTASGWEARCPAHEDKRASLSIAEGEDGRILLNCFAGCTAQNICSVMGLKLADLFKDKPVGSEKPRIVKIYPYVDAEGQLLYEVVRYDPKDFRQRRPDPDHLGGLIWNMRDVPRVLYRLPSVMDAIELGHIVFIVEGEKDADNLAALGFSSTCNVGGAGKWQPGYTATLTGANVVILPDKDKPGLAHGQAVASDLVPVARSVKLIELPDRNGRPIKDVSDWLAAGGTADELKLLVDAAPAWTQSRPLGLTIRTPDEIIDMTFDDADMILGDRLLAKAQSLVIAGAGGLGKSRLVLQLAAATVTAQDFVGLVTRAHGLRWLIVQTENSNRRLQSDLLSIRAWLGAEGWAAFNERVVIHTVETNADGFLSLDDEAARRRLADAIENHRPDVIVFDPLGSFTSGDLNSDMDMRSVLTAISQLAKTGNPDRAIIIIHHALTGKVGAGRAMGYERSGFARNSKVLHAWCREQMNLAPGNPDSNDSLVLTCGKCSNGKEFPPFAVRLDPRTMIYAVDPGFDLAAWQSEVTGKTNHEPLMSPDRVGELCRGPMNRKELVDAVREDCMCTRESAYRYIKRAEAARKLKFDKCKPLFVSKL